MASTIKVDNVQNQPGTNVVNKCGTTVNIGAASDNIRSAGNNLQASDGGNLISQSGTDITIGASGDAVALASGATQTGFGRTGTVDWVTTPVTSTPTTGVSGSGYFLNTTSGILTINLPASPSAGDIMGVADYAGTASSNNITIGRNSSNITGAAVDATISADRDSLTLVYVDGTQGWLPVNDNTGAIINAGYVTATGGTPCAGATSGDYKIHSFTGPGTLTVSCGGNVLGSNTIDYLVVAGGGGGGQAVPMPWSAQGGGGGGGFRESVPSPAAWTGSPLANPGNARPVTATPYAITVGGGGAVNTIGSNSIFSDITSTGGGEGGCGPSAPFAGGNGGSGGGGGYGATCTEGSGNTPSQSPPQGKDGGSANASNGAAAGGGGATVAAGSIVGPASTTGGAGATSCIVATPTAYAGGGGGGNDTPDKHAPGGVGGGGIGGSPSSTNAGAGTTNTGGGGGGSGNQNPSTGGAGGSGIVIIRYKFQN